MKIEINEKLRIVNDKCQFGYAMNAAGIGINDPINPDGQLHRFTVSGDKPNTLNGWYVFHDGEISAGAFGCWKRGINHTWCSKSKNEITATERRNYVELIQNAAEQRKQELLKRQEAARQRAGLIWEKSIEVESHPYLIRKQVKSFGLRQYGDSLVMPIRNISGRLHSLQFIKPDGAKLMLSGCRKKSMFYLIGNPDDILLICEGYSTGATLHECTGYPVAIAIDAGNLKTVGQSFRHHYPAIKLIYCADNDQFSKVNVGIKKAREAALAVNGFIAVPEFKNTSTRPTDFNDLYLLEGLEAFQRVVL